VQELGPIFKTAYHHASMNEVELLAIDSGVLNVVKNKFHIERNPEKLSGNLSMQQEK